MPVRQVSRFRTVRTSALVLVAVAIAVLIYTAGVSCGKEAEDLARLQAAVASIDPYPGSILVYASKDSVHVVRNYAVQAQPPAEQINQYYAQTLLANGWSLGQIKTPQTVPGVGLCADKPGMRVVITYSGLPRGSYTYSLGGEVNVRCPTQ